MHLLEARRTLDIASELHTMLAKICVGQEHDIGSGVKYRAWSELCSVESQPWKLWWRVKTGS